MATRWIRWTDRLARPARRRRSAGKMPALHSRCSASLGEFDDLVLIRVRPVNRFVVDRHLSAHYVCDRRRRPASSGDADNLRRVEGVEILVVESEGALLAAGGIELLSEYCRVDAARLRHFQDLAVLFRHERRIIE